MTARPPLGAAEHLLLREYGCLTFLMFAPKQVTLWIST